MSFIDRFKNLIKNGTMTKDNLKDYLEEIKKRNTTDGGVLIPTDQYDTILGLINELPDE